MVSLNLLISYFELNFQHESNVPREHESKSI